jgi:hypothetical protein
MIIGGLGCVNRSATSLTEWFSTVICRESPAPYSGRETKFGNIL